MDTSLLDEWQRQADKDGVDLIVGALVLREGRFFTHRRSYDRKLFPGCWDLAGGSAENGEGLYDALERELREETKWELDQVLGLATVFDWSDGDRMIREFDFVVTVKGTAEAILEAGKAIEGRWIASDETSAVAERGNDKMKEIYDAGFLLIKDL